MVVSQHVADTDRFSQGAVLIRLPEVDVSTLRGGLLLGRLQEGNHIAWLKVDEYALGFFSVGKPEVAILPFEGWERGLKYAVRLNGIVKSPAGVPFAEGTWLVSIVDKRTPVAAARQPAEGDDPVKAIRFSAQESFFRTASGQLIPQTVVDGDRDDKQAGVVYVTLSGDVSRDTIVRSVDLGLFRDGKPVWLQSQEYAVGLVDTRKPLMAMFPYKGWDHGAEYVFRFRDTATNLAGKPIAEDGAAWIIEIPEHQPVPPAAPKKAQKASGSANTLGGRFPGGQNLLFQGAWTDPATGLAYHRGRWYDPSTGVFLSEDPKGAIDSENLYALGRWAPHMYIDPLGMAVLVTQGDTQQVRIEDEKNLAELHAFLASKGYSGDVHTFSQAMAALNPSTDLANLSRNQMLNFTGVTVEHPAPQGGNLPQRLMTASTDIVRRHYNAAPDVDAARQLRALGMPVPNVQGARTGIESQEWKNPATRRGLEECGVSSIDCIGYPSETVSSAYAAGGNRGAAARYRNRASAVDMQSDLVSEGWTAYYFTSNSGLSASPGDPQWKRDTAYLNSLLFGSSDTYTAGSERLEVTGVIADYGVDVSGNPNAALEQLRSIPFAIGSFEGGMHSFVFRYGSVYEVHWDQPHDSRTLFDITPIEDPDLMRWSHGVIVVPPSH
jgi:RHS repeat-associated protein